MATEIDKQQEYYDEYHKYLIHLFVKARDRQGIEYIYTLLRVSGIEDGGWDPFVEAEEALNDLSKILRSVSKKGITKSSLRMALLIYCHSVEMSAPYQILFNLLRCSQGKDYNLFPFPGRPKGKKFPYEVIPASPTAKIGKLKEEATKADEAMLIDHINSFFRDDIRNAFYHSDYTITDKEFRICENRHSNTTSLDELSVVLTRCFAFYQAFFNVYKQARHSFRKMKKLHRLPNFEVLELMTNKKEGLVGFKMHFSNDSEAYFERKKERVYGVNLHFQRDLSINFNAGNLDALQYKWRARGKNFRELNTRYNDDGEWRPIQFHGKVEKIMHEIEAETKDDAVQGCLFYIHCTGHESIEFAVKSDKELFQGKEFSEAKIKLVGCGKGTDGSFLYDGTYFVNSRKSRPVKAGINAIRTFMQRHKDAGIKSSYCLKYQTKRVMKPSKVEGNTLHFSFSDPRNTMYASDFRMLPRSDWKIQAEWIDEN